MGLEPVEVAGQIYLTNDARRIGERHPLVPRNDLDQLLKLVDRISSRETSAADDLPSNKESVMAARDVTNISDWL